MKEENKKLITLIEMLEREINEISNFPKVGHRAISAAYLVNKIEWAVRDKKPIDLEEIDTTLKDLDIIKNKSEKEVIEIIQNMGEEDLKEIAFIKALSSILESQSDDKEINAEEVAKLAEFEQFMIKNGLIGNPIKTIKHNGCHAYQFQNYKIVIIKDDMEANSVVCDYFKKATKLELIQLIEQYEREVVSCK